MWALRRAANPSRSHGARILIPRTFLDKPDIPLSSLRYGHSSCHADCDGTGCRFFPKAPSLRPSFSSIMSFSCVRNFSFQSGEKSSDHEDELEGFSDLDLPPEDDKRGEVAGGDDEELISAGDVSEDDNADNSLGVLDADQEPNGENGAVKKFASPDSPLSKVIIESTRQSLKNVLDKWVEEGNSIGWNEFSTALFSLRKRRLYGKALQFVEWVEAKKCLYFVERDYASHLDLVAKVHGLQKAEIYIDNIPESCRSEIIYRTYLANCVAAKDVKKAEEAFNKIKDLGFPITTSACNQLLFLYKRVDRKKIADVLLVMEKENIKPSHFTYGLLIDTKGQVNGISSMEQIVETMKAEGVEPGLHIQAKIARQYLYGGVKEKAETIMEEMEASGIKENRAACKMLLPLYADLGKLEDVKRVWKVCETNPPLDECLAAIEAWGKLGRIEDAERIFENMVRSRKSLSSRHYSVLLKVYANHKLLTKGKDLVKRMAESGCKIGPLTWDALVKLYAEAGEVEKADSILQKAAQQNQARPLYCSYIAVLEKYSERGDIHNAEKIFNRLRQMGYDAKIRQYQALLQAYINAKTPAYGFRERMKADNMFPNKAVGAQLLAVDAFRKTHISDLLD